MGGQDISTGDLLKIMLRGDSKAKRMAIREYYRASMEWVDRGHYYKAWKECEGDEKATELLEIAINRERKRKDAERKRKAPNRHGDVDSHGTGAQQHV